MRRQLLPALIMMAIMTVLLGVVYTFAFTGFAQVAAPGTANGSRVQVNGKDVGSEYIGQAWVNEDGDPLREYFQSRPSYATTNSDAGYDPSLSLGSNLGPSNPCFVPDPRDPCLDEDGKEILPVVVQRVRDYRELNDLADDVSVPVDAVTASASGLDPDISVANARLQAERIAGERGVSEQKVLALIDEHTAGRTIGILGEKRVNVLLLNLALDKVASVNP